MIFFRKAVLIIHGFAGGTYDEENLAIRLERHAKLDVYSFTLPGHDKLGFRTKKYNEWVDASEEQLNRLISYGYKDIYLIGHSMGGVIATYLASKYKCVKKLVLAAPAFTYLTFGDNSKTLDKVKSAIDAIKENDKDEIVTRFLKLPLTSISEFIKLINQYAFIYKEIKVPTLILHGKDDTIVQPESSKNIYDSIKSKKKKIVFLDNESHDLFEYIDSPAIDYVENFLK